ncbi:MAG TPA: NADH-quinone oxidoreductase subunit NuoH [Planctomycetaceae bacterium]|jgi:NADH-quinone oxidoreductase subunit H|nr:NADH-quinone oxidoreductase subunit NuoH [Planctomycetaceae bacterium]
MNWIHAVVAIVVVLGGVLTTCMYLIWIERKVSARIQDRIGPNRVGPFGLLQSVADGIKFVLKEDVIPATADKALFIIAPTISVFTTMLAFSVVPFGPLPSQPGGFPFGIAPNLDIGILFVFAVTSLAVYGVILGGWSSNNKYSALGSLRSSAQVVSYEVPLGLSVLGVGLLAGSFNLETVISRQAVGFFHWNIWFQPLAWLIFFASGLAESNRLPFDLPECEQELVGGYHTEYSALKFAMFFLAEYTHVITISFLTAIMFFGGWHFPWIAEPESAYTGVTVVKVLVLLAKVGGVITFIMVIRWTIPRFRFDQLMALTWKVFIPLSLANLLGMMIVKQYDLSLWWMLPFSAALVVVTTGVSLWMTRGVPENVAAQWRGRLT